MALSGNQTASRNNKPHLLYLVTRLNQAYDDENVANKSLFQLPMAIDGRDVFTDDTFSASTSLGPLSLGQFQPYPRRGNEACSVLR
jgi:hypothetical protein